MRGIIIRFALIAAAAAIVAIVATRMLAVRLGRWVASVPAAPPRDAALASAPAIAPAPDVPDLAALHLTHGDAGFRAAVVPARLAAQGLRNGDLLVAIDGQPVRDADALLQAGQSARGRPTLQLTFRRGTTDFEVTVDAPP